MRQDETLDADLMRQLSTIEFSDEWGADMHELSAANWDMYDDDKEDFVIKKVGYRPLLDHLA